MKKYLKIIGISSSVVIVVVGSWFYRYVQNYNPMINEEHIIFLRHFDGSNSTINIFCFDNSDCELRGDIETACGEVVAIAKHNSNNFIEEYNKKAEQILNNYNFDCEMTLPINKLKPVCENNVCTIKEKF